MCSININTLCFFRGRKKAVAENTCAKQQRAPIGIARVWYLPVCMLIHCIAGIPALSQENQIAYPLVRTPENVQVNYKQPKGILKPDEGLTVTFSKEPTDEEIFRVHFFEEPLVPMEGSYNAEENNGLVLALAAFSQRSNPDDFSAVTRFLKDYPKSRWRGALLANLGIVYRRTGYYNQAMDALARGMGGDEEGKGV